MSDDRFADIETMVAAMKTHDTEARLMRVLNAYGEFARTQPTIGPAPDRRVAWIDKILEIEDLPGVHRHRLVLALVPLIGPEALAAMSAVLVPSHDEAMDALRWSGLSLLYAARDAVAAERKHATRDP